MCHRRLSSLLLTGHWESVSLGVSLCRCLLVPFIGSSDRLRTNLLVELDLALAMGVVWFGRHVGLLLILLLCCVDDGLWLYRHS